jgi:hypothetical protein
VSTFTPGDPYALPYPVSGDVANVPADMKALADKVSASLNLKLNAANVPTSIQKKITIQNGTGAPTGTFVDGDIVFMIPPGT